MGGAEDECPERAEAEVPSAETAGGPQAEQGVEERQVEELEETVQLAFVEATVAEDF